MEQRTATHEHALLTPAQAERVTGKARSTLYRAVKKGRLSARQDGQGNTVYDVAELERVYGLLKAGAPARTSANATPRSAVHEGERERSHELERRLLREQIERLEGQVQDWKEQATAQTRLLTDQREEVRRKDEERRELERERVTLAERTAKAEAATQQSQAEAERLRQELADERSKGFWRRLFG